MVFISCIALGIAFSLVQTVASTLPLRLTINGSAILDENLKPIQLRGSTWNVGEVKTDEGQFMLSLLPGATVVRLVGVFWDDRPNAGLDVSNAHPGECMTNTPPNYFNDQCFKQLDEAVSWATQAGLWIVITGRAEYAAGQNYQKDPMSDVFHNSTLRSMYMAMWTHVAGHFKSQDRIAAYEIMAEPRDKAVTQETVTSFYTEGCKTVHAVDPRTPCMVGSRSYYKLWTFDDQVIIPNSSSVIYTFDYFVPEKYVMDEDQSMNYSDPPSSYSCQLMYPGWVDACCPNGSKEMVAFDQAWHVDNLKRFALPVPLFVNQWGAQRNIGDNRGRLNYVSDLVKVFNGLGLSHAWYTWRVSWDSSWSGLEIIHDYGNGSVGIDHGVLNALRPSF